MSSPYAPGPLVHLAVEQLEAREVPASFGLTRGLSIAFGDVLQTNNQPGLGQIITGSGPGTVGTVNIFTQNQPGNPLSGFLVKSFKPFGQSFTGGVYVAVADVFGVTAAKASVPELIVSTAPGTTGRVKVYSFEFGAMRERANFTPFGVNYTGGVQISTGLVTGDVTTTQPKRNIVVGMQTGGSTVKVYSIQGGQARQIRQFQAFEPGYTGGISIAASNIDNQVNPAPNPQRIPNLDYAEIIVGRAANFPEVRVFRADMPTAQLEGSYFAFDLSNAANRTGIEVFAANTDGVRGAEVYVWRKNTLTVKVFDGETATLRGLFQAYNTGLARSVNMTADFTSPPGGPEPPDGKGTAPANSVYVVAADGPYNQIPIEFPGAAGSPAGFNGSKFV